jgi:hypothetical protein
MPWTPCVPLDEPKMKKEIEDGYDSALTQETLESITASFAES